ncbi:hypothetical protein [Fictibacillus fluitans]|uniref:Uncharacterized protein n=1 Tax=Fictibacillus fluitans TaxID=3058422 RepID=A0ABT8HWE1_9BACL|nr:hypothetical protein [Fictibacillus sp. NE201]MDN4525103.1 hypothetical protein [Fictibacillus sp. NE201]
MEDNKGKSKPQEFKIEKSGCGCGDKDNAIKGWVAGSVPVAGEAEVKETKQPVSIDSYRKKGFFERVKTFLKFSK